MMLILHSQSPLHILHENPWHDSIFYTSIRDFSAKSKHNMFIENRKKFINKTLEWTFDKCGAIFSYRFSLSKNEVYYQNT